MSRYYCETCRKWAEFDDYGYEDHDCPNGCGALMMTEDEYEEIRSIAEDPYGDLGGPQGYAQGEDGNWYPV